MMKTQSYHGLLGAALVLAMAGGVTAQEFRATVRGQVVDASQAALPGATVNVQNQETNEVATATTNNEGAYTVPFLRPGLYTLTVEMGGFQKHTRKDMRLSVGEMAVINVALAVAGVAEEVTVIAESPLLETSQADRGTVIDSARIAELPLQSRSPMALVVLVAGVNYNAQAIYLRPFDNGALADWSMNGGQNRNNEFLLDGAPNNANQSGNNIAYVPPAAARPGVQGRHQLLRRAVRPHRRRRRQHVAEVGHQLVPRRNLRLHAAQGAGRQFVPPQLAQHTEDRSVHRSVRVQRGWPDLEEQDVLPVHGREVPGRHAGPALQHGADAGDEERRLQRSRGRVRQPDQDLRPDTPAARSTASGPAISSPATSFRRAASTTPPGRSCSTTRTRTASPPAWRRGSRTCTGPSTSTRTCSGTGSARSTTTSARTTAPTSGGVKTSGTRSAIGGPTPSAPVPPRAASFRSGAPTVRWSATGCTSSAPGLCSTSAPATPTSWSGAIPNTRSVSIRRSSGPRASSARCPARPSAASSRRSRSISSRACRAARPRTGTGTTRFSRTCR